MNRNDGDREYLTQAMLALEGALDRIAGKYAEHVSVVEEDPESFGAGHVVFYPTGSARARFAIEEQYAAGTDWSHPDRLPTSWLWRAERLTGLPSGKHVWGLQRFGETFSEDLSPLLTEVETWARKIQNRASMPAPFDPALTRDMRPPAPGL